MEGVCYTDTNPDTNPHTNPDPVEQVEKRIDQMRLMLEKKDLTIDELRSRLNRAMVAEDGANVSCDQVGSCHRKATEKLCLLILRKSDACVMFRKL